MVWGSRSIELQREEAVLLIIVLGLSCDHIEAVIITEIMNQDRKDREFNSEATTSSSASSTLWFWSDSHRVCFGSVEGSCLS